eukprot:COSAG02_NODE_1250_length_13626_cov_72.701929_3_plen_76_part_00
MRLNATTIYCVIPTPRESSESISSTPVCSKARLFERTLSFKCCLRLTRSLYFSSAARSRASWASLMAAPWFRLYV